MNIYEVIITTTTRKGVTTQTITTTKIGTAPNINWGSYHRMENGRTRKVYKVWADSKRHALSILNSNSLVLEV